MVFLLFSQAFEAQHEDIN